MGSTMIKWISFLVTFFAINSCGGDDSTDRFIWGLHIYVVNTYDASHLRNFDVSLSKPPNKLLIGWSDSSSNGLKKSWHGLSSKAIYIGGSQCNSEGELRAEFDNTPFHLVVKKDGLSILDTTIYGSMMSERAKGSDETGDHLRKVDTLFVNFPDTLK